MQHRSVVRSSTPTAAISAVVLLAICAHPAQAFRRALRATGDHVNEMTGAIGIEFSIPPDKGKQQLSSTRNKTFADIFPSVAEVFEDVPKGKLALTIVIAIVAVALYIKIIAAQRAGVLPAMQPDVAFPLQDPSRPRSPRISMNAVERNNVYEGIQNPGVPRGNRVQIGYAVDDLGYFGRAGAVGNSSSFGNVGFRASRTGQHATASGNNPNRRGTLVTASMGSSTALIGGDVDHGNIDNSISNRNIKGRINSDNHAANPSITNKPAPIEHVTNAHLNNSISNRNMNGTINSDDRAVNPNTTTKPAPIEHAVNGNIDNSINGDIKGNINSDGYAANPNTTNKPAPIEHATNGNSDNSRNGDINGNIDSNVHAVNSNTSNKPSPIEHATNGNIDNSSHDDSHGNDANGNNENELVSSPFPLASVTTSPVQENSSREKIQDNGDSWYPLISSNEQVEESSAFPKRFMGTADSSMRRWGKDDLLRRDSGSLGRGQFASVIAAMIQPNMSLAVKIIPRDLDKEHNSQDKFIHREKELMGLCSDHPNVVNLFGAIKTSTTSYFIMPVARTDLGKMIDEHLLDETTAISIARQIVSAIEYVHGKRIVHRDVKPANLLMDGDTVLLADFGCSKQLPTGSETIDGLAGTKPYLSPEQVSDERYGTPADVWAVGVVVFEMLHGRTPFCPEGGEGKEEGAATIDNRPSIEEYKGAGSGESKGGGVVGKKMRYTAFDELEREHIKRGEYVVDEGRVSKTGAAFISQLLQVPVAERVRAENALEHEWLGDPATHQAYRSFVQGEIARRSAERQQDQAGGRVIRKGRRVCKVKR